MLTEADKKIVEKDTLLPGLAALLDEELLLDGLKTLPPFKNAVKAEIQYLRYKPGNSCACTVRITLADGSQHYYYAKALTEARFRQSWNKPSLQKLVREGGPLAPLAIDTLYIILRHPAHDRDIGHLSWLTCKEQRRHLLKACSLSETDGDELDIKILRYKPERRLVARVSKNRRPIAIIRSANPEEFAKMLIGNAFGVSHGGVSLLGADGASCTLATNWQKGTSLCPEDGVLPTAELTEKLGKQLARIHAATYKHPVEYGIGDEVKSLRGVINTFKHILPEQTEWFECLADKVEQGLGTVTQTFALVHGDFSLDQVIQRESKTGETKLHILDWDRSAYGLPFMDLATFQARLELQVIEGALPRWRADEILDTFLNAYQRRSGADLKGLYWFTASAILRLGAEPFRKRDPQWEQHTLQLLQRAEEILAKADAFYIKPEQKVADKPQDTLLDTLLDKAQMQTRLCEAGMMSAREDILSAVLRRYKAKRRALVDYRIGNGESIRYLIGKYRTKGLDKRSYRIQKQLWQSGFTPKAPVSVPEAIGTLPELHTWFQSRVNGQSIGDILIPANGRLDFLGRAVARAIHTLHQSKVAQTLELPCWTPLDELAILQQRLTEAQAKLPQLAGRIAAVLEGCATLARQLPDAPQVSLHRDFYQDQVLELYGKPGHIVLLDLDLVCQGPAALDAGNYIAHIQELALRHYGSANALNVHETAFRTAFLAASTAGAGEVETYTTLSLARHIAISTLFESRAHTTETLLNLCETRLYTHFA
ncbi:phosphotransferase [Neisseria dentiae]|uniref:phosphotransferase n=1 Tax=Neisseria dentiae TaxID=194197 RepID=UPI0035A0EEEF